MQVPMYSHEQEGGWPISVTVYDSKGKKLFTKNGKCAKGFMVRVAKGIAKNKHGVTSGKIEGVIRTPKKNIPFTQKF